MWVPKRANYQYRYGAAQYRYWYQFWLLDLQVEDVSFGGKDSRQSYETP
jgi:hypothetical protein